MPRVLLLLPTSTYRAADFLRAARSLGADVVVASEHRQALAGAMADRAVVVPLGKPQAAVEAIASLHARAPLDAVVAVDDQGVVVAAQASQQLGLRHNPPDAVAATRDKIEMRRRLDSARVLQPSWVLAHPGDDAGAVAAVVGFPCVVKPVSSSASRGVIRADDAQGAVRAAARIRTMLAEDGADPGGPLLVEAFVPGPEVAVEALVDGGAMTVLAVFDKPDPLDGPYFEETLFVTPSRHPAAVLEAVEHRAAEAVAALGLREGPVHAELRLGTEADSDGRAIAVVEVAARTIGGLCARCLRFGMGVSLEELVLRHALGMSLSGLAREPAASGVMMLPIPANGVLIEVRGQEEARAVPGVAGLEISVAAGRQLRALPEGDRYLGFVFARAESPDEVEGALRAAAARLEVVLGPPPT